KSGGYYVFVVPVAEELDLKKAAKASGEKSIDMIKQKDLLPLTGYVHGGCSPIGMKKQFPTFIHETATGFEKRFVSAGKVGLQIELSPADLISVVRCRTADIICG
ncbi:MAG: aminoacyl-tRNA deacylase, partial [Lachnospiraceae bacterium]|nr:aminoacyl-tRNA deacylase [Lachnospiraceae bacterium]